MKSQNDEILSHFDILFIS